MPGLVTIRATGVKEIDAKFRKLAAAGGGGPNDAGRTAIARFHVWFANECATAWKAIKAAGGIYRGVVWPGMKPQYTRKDGTEVPAWGGVEKIRFKTGTFTQIFWTKRGKRAKKTKLVGDVGVVKPRKRPSGKPVTVRSIMMQDTGNLRNDFLYKPKRLDGKRMILEPSAGNLEYAEAQNDRRPFAFFTQKDADTFRRITEVALDEAIRKAGLA